MKAFIENEFNISITSIKELAGYDNKNYLITANGHKFIYKTYVDHNNLYDTLEAENDTLVYLQNSFHSKIPTPIAFKDKSHLKRIKKDDVHHIHRILSFLEGTFLGDAPHSTELFKSLGTFLARLDLSLIPYTNYVIQSRQWEWDLQYFDLNKKYIEDITDPKKQNIVHYFFQQYEENVRPLIPFLRKQIIHNDANEWNVLVNGDEISGIIDFGDLAHSFVINELAIAITYACYDKENPVRWAVIIIEAYHKIFPLKAKEVKVLYYLIAARLCTSVCNSAHARKTSPDNVYASVSEKSAWKMLYKWLAINPLYAENAFRNAIGLETLQPKPLQDVINRRHTHLSTILSMSYNTPIEMSRAAFQYMYDTSGNTFLDAYNNIPHVGHSHPKVVAAAQKQIATLNTNTRYLFDEIADYAEKLITHFPPSLTRVFLVNSGSAASDLAMRLAKSHTRQKHMMVMESGYHGNTQMTIDISDYKFNNPKGQGQKSHIIKTPLPNYYRGKYEDLPNAGELYGKDAVTQIENNPFPIAAFVSEPIVGCAGQVPLASGYLKEVYPAIRAQGGVCISDEVQTGFGRLGHYFWGFEAHGVIPDIVILGKPIANSHPMGAVVCTEEIANSFEKGVEFFSSFGGNPVSCSIATAVLQVIEEEQLQENAQIVGDYYIGLVKDLMNKHKCIGDVRGSGLFIGIEIVKPNSKEPDTVLAHRIKNELREHYILVSTDGPFDNVIKTKPPLCFSKQNAETVVQMIDQVLNTRIP
jgi:4-aminobutyrate aminotransferase-like enzyme